MQNIHHSICGVIPPHVLTRVAETADEAGHDAQATLDHMRELTHARTMTLVNRAAARSQNAPPAQKRLNVYDAHHHTRLPGTLVMSEQKPHSSDVEAQEAFDGSGATYDFYARVFGRHSIDNRGMRIDSTVHYASRFDNAMWDGRQMVYGDGDGRIFHRFTAALDVIGHELTHGVTQHTAGLGYSGQTGALNEHISDAFGTMVKQYILGQTVQEADWLIGAGLFTSKVHGRAIRSMAAPGFAYDDPILGRDPQPAHMRDYVETEDDDGGVHINSGIPNHAFYRAAMAIGGHSWEVPGTIWYAVLTRRLRPDSDFHDFARATVDVAGELFGNGGKVQRAVAGAWSDVGLPVPLFASAQASAQECVAAVPRRPASMTTVPKWRQRPLR